MITRRSFVMLAGIGAMGLLGTPGCAALTEESPRDVAEEGGPRESSSPTPQKEPINAGEPFSGEIAPGMLCVAEYATNALAVVDARAGEVVGRIPVGRNPASVLVMQGIVFVGSVLFNNATTCCLSSSIHFCNKVFVSSVLSFSYTMIW